MSGGSFCVCPDVLKRPVAQRNWYVTTRWGNHSAFNGYRFTPSRYSAVRCGTCGRSWRTTAAYVNELPDGVPY